MRATLSSSGSFSMGHNRRATASNFGGDRDEGARLLGSHVVKPLARCGGAADGVESTPKTTTAASVVSTSEPSLF